MGGVLTYGGDNNFGIISEDKQADLEQLENELFQMRDIMNQMRVSQDTSAVLSHQAVNPSLLDRDNDQRSSLLSILSKVR